MAIDYNQLAQRLRTELTDFIVDGGNNPILAKDQFVPPHPLDIPDYPFIVAHIPLGSSEDNVGVNPPRIHDIKKVVQSEVIAQGSVDDVDTTGNLAGKVLIDEDVDFQNLDVSSTPAQIMPTNHVTNTTTGKTTEVIEVLDQYVLKLKDPIFTSKGESYEIQRTGANYEYLSGRIIDLRFQCLDSPVNGRSEFQAIGNVNSISEQLHDWFAAHADAALKDLCFLVDPLGDGLGDITEADMSPDQGTGQTQIIYRRDFDVRLKHTKALEREVAAGEYVERVSATIDTSNPSSTETFEI